MLSYPLSSIARSPIHCRRYGHSLAVVRALRLPKAKLAKKPESLLHCCPNVQDTTTNVLWTGEKKTQTGPTGQAAKMMRRYERMGYKFNLDNDETAAEDTGQQPGVRKST